MIDESTVELIHADIDGCLPAAPRAELGSILLAERRRELCIAT